VRLGVAALGLLLAADAQVLKVILVAALAVGFVQVVGRHLPVGLRDRVEERAELLLRLGLIAIEVEVVLGDLARSVLLLRLLQSCRSGLVDFLLLLLPELLRRFRALVLLVAVLEPVVEVISEFLEQVHLVARSHLASAALRSRLIELHAHEVGFFSAELSLLDEVLHLLDVVPLAKMWVHGHHHATFDHLVEGLGRRAVLLLILLREGRATLGDRQQVWLNQVLQEALVVDLVLGLVEGGGLLEPGLTPWDHFVVVRRLRVLFPGHHVLCIEKGELKPSFLPLVRLLNSPSLVVFGTFFAAVFVIAPVPACWRLVEGGVAVFSSLGPTQAVEGELLLVILSWLVNHLLNIEASRAFVVW